MRQYRSNNQKTKQHASRQEHRRLSPMGRTGGRTVTPPRDSGSLRQIFRAAERSQNLGQRARFPSYRTRVLTLEVLETKNEHLLFLSHLLRRPGRGERTRRR